jgi:hypothetical protein
MMQRRMQFRYGCAFVSILNIVLKSSAHTRGHTASHSRESCFQKQIQLMTKPQPHCRYPSPTEYRSDSDRDPLQIWVVVHVYV